MEKEDLIQIDLNQANLEQMTSLPGIGQSMAERIVAGRPYHEVEELVRVKGLGGRTLERIRPFLTIDKAEIDLSVGSEEGASSPRDKRTSADKQSLIDRFEDITRTSMERFRISSPVVGFVLITATISVIFSVILSLAILGGINRTLNFGRHSAVREMGSDISLIDSQLDALAADLASVDQLA